MKASDITPGSEYAYQYRPWNSAIRVLAVEKAITPGSRSSSPQPGWKVVCLEDGAGWTKGSTMPCTERQIIAPWAAYQANIQTARERKRAEQAEREVRQ